MAMTCAGGSIAVSMGCASTQIGHGNPMLTSDPTTRTTREQPGQKSADSARASARAGAGVDDHIFNRTTLQFALVAIFLAEFRHAGRCRDRAVVSAQSSSARQGCFVSSAR
ncbi:hypothetical protein FXW78_45605 [Rhodococcus opacus]|nr:hypothetical protein [Rhodococcus opacus]